MTSVDEFLAAADDVIADWEGSWDAASWSADGSHQEPEPLPPARMYLAPWNPAPRTSSAWTEIGWADAGSILFADETTNMGEAWRDVRVSIQAVVQGATVVLRAVADFTRVLATLGLLPDEGPPPPKTRSGMTAREYRAARRAYRRRLDAARKARR